VRVRAGGAGEVRAIALALLQPAELYPARGASAMGWRRRAWGPRVVAIGGRTRRQLLAASVICTRPFANKVSDPQTSAHALARSSRERNQKQDEGVGAERAESLPLASRSTAAGAPSSPARRSWWVGLSREEFSRAVRERQADIARRPSLMPFAENQYRRRCKAKPQRRPIEKDRAGRPRWIEWTPRSVQLQIYDIVPLPRSSDAPRYAWSGETLQDAVLARLFRPPMSPVMNDVVDLRLIGATEEEIGRRLNYSVRHVRRLLRKVDHVCLEDVRF
jgi:hypothetical protein